MEHKNAQILFNLPKPQIQTQTGHHFVGFYKFAEKTAICMCCSLSNTEQNCAN